MMTLCWGCGNAVPDAEGERGCPWSREGKPVEGWVAERRDIRIQPKRPGEERRAVEKLPGHYMPGVCAGVRRTMKMKKLIAVIVLAGALVLLGGCRESDRVSHNISQEADNFKRHSKNHGYQCPG